MYDQFAPSPIPSPAAASLVKASGEKIPITKPVFTLGRSLGSDLPLDSPHVGRSHCDIIFKNGQFLVVDRGSKNHTWVNGDRIQPQVETPLKHGHRIKAADVELEFHLE
jgi:pSer/pThr/pTyr-binding forkhead associated (FHA) protein